MDIGLNFIRLADPANLKVITNAPLQKRRVAVGQIDYSADLYMYIYLITTRYPIKK